MVEGFAAFTSVACNRVQVLEFRVQSLGFRCGV